MQQFWRGALVCLAALPLCGCGGSSAPNPGAALAAKDSSVYGRYYRDCVQRDPFHDKRARHAACGCLYAYAKSNFNEIETELMIARTSGDKSKAQEITARPDFDNTAFKRKASGIMKEVVSCSMTRAAR